MGSDCIVLDIIELSEFGIGLDRTRYDAIGYSRDSNDEIGRAWTFVIGIAVDVGLGRMGPEMMWSDVK